VATIHRAENTDDAGRLRAIVRGLAAIDTPVRLLAHPRLRAAAAAADIKLEQGAITVHDPMPYPQLIAAVLNSSGVVTDSGGLQKEAYLLRRMCTTVRPETEWVETVDSGWNMLVSSDLSLLPSVVSRAVAVEPTDQPYGDGHAAQRVADELTRRSN
jgi:UDP-N-acetylglucosamine 2-epimerase (non-hydrolysing)